MKEGENLSNSGKRRLRYLRRSQPYKINATVRKIANEASIYLTDEFKDTMAKISGQDWPNEVAACSDFNTGGCILPFSHAPKKQRQDKDLILQHVCAVCLQVNYCKKFKKLHTFLFGLQFSQNTPKN